MTQTTAFLLTLAIELPLVVLGAWLARVPRATRRTLPLVALGANALTHPLLWLVDPLLASAIPRALRWGVLESTIVLVEGAIYARVGRVGGARGLLLALLANAASFGVGLWIYYGRG